MRHRGSLLVHRCRMALICARTAGTAVSTASSRSPPRQAQKFTPLLLSRHLWLTVQGLDSTVDSSADQVHPRTIERGVQMLAPGRRGPGPACSLKAHSCIRAEVLEWRGATSSKALETHRSMGPGWGVGGGGGASASSLPPPPTPSRVPPPLPSPNCTSARPPALPLQASLAPPIEASR